MKLPKWMSRRPAGNAQFYFGYVLWALLVSAVAVGAFMLVEAFQVSGVLQHGFEVQARFREAQFLADRVLRYEVDQETGVRGYTSTGDRLFLQPFYEATSQLPVLAPRLRSDLQWLEMPETIALLSNVHNTDERWVDTVGKPLIRDWRRGRDDALQRRGKALMDRIRDDVARIQKLLADRAPQVDRDTSAQLRRSTQLISAVIFAGVGLIIVIAGIQYRGRLVTERLRGQAVRDPLTGLFNRRFLQGALELQLAQAGRTGRPLSVALFDIDHFKRFNDAFGHEAGDFALREVAETLRRGARKGDVVCRYGGEEFLILFPGMSALEGRQRIDTLRREMKECAIIFRGEAFPPIMLSAGIAAYPDCADSPEGLIDAADRALYAAKHLGRDRVALAPPALA